MARNVFDISRPGNRALLGWIGGGIVVVAAGIWGVVTYVWPPHHPGDNNCAENASIASSGNVSGATINATGARLQANGTTVCGNKTTK